MRRESNKILYSVFKTKSLWFCQRTVLYKQDKHLEEPPTSAKVQQVGTTSAMFSADEQRRGEASSQSAKSHRAAGAAQQLMRVRRSQIAPQLLLFHGGGIKFRERKQHVTVAVD